MFLLAQLGLSDAGSVPHLPDPPFLAWYFLENPWPVAIAATAAGVVVMLIARRQGKAESGTRLMFAGIALACVVLMLGYLVTTEREVLRERTRALGEFTVAAQTTSLRELLTDQSRIAPFVSGMVNYSGVRGRDEVLDAVRSRIAEFGPFESHEIGPVQAIVDGTNLARTQVRVWAKPRKDMQVIGASTGLWLRIDWRREGNDGPWRASAITIMQIDGVGMNKDMGRD